MPTQEYDNYEDDDADDDLEGTDQRDIARFDGDTIPCPDCGQEIYAEAFRCPYCKSLLTDDERTESHKTPPWIIITTVLCIIMAVLWILWRNIPSR